ncbi:MAG: hypothetical protein WC600_18410 [Desulfobaccales bacterium]
MALTLDQLSPTTEDWWDPDFKAPESFCNLIRALKKLYDEDPSPEALQAVTTVLGWLAVPPLGNPVYKKGEC